MESHELDPDDDGIDLTAELSEVHEHVPSRLPTRMPAGTIAPLLHLDGDDLDSLRTQAEAQRSEQSWDELSRTLRRIIDLGSSEDAMAKTRRSSCTRSSARSRATCSGRSARRSMPGAN